MLLRYQGVLFCHEQKAFSVNDMVIKQEHTRKLSQGVTMDFIVFFSLSFADKDKYTFTLMQEIENQYIYR